MHTEISKTEFKARALELFRQIEATGEPLIVTDHGRPTLEIRPFRPVIEDAQAKLAGTVLYDENPFEPVGLEDWEALK